MSSKPLFAIGQKAETLVNKASRALARQMERATALASRARSEDEQRSRMRPTMQGPLAPRDILLHQAHAQVASLSSGPAAKPVAAPAHHPKLGLQSPGLHLAQISRPVGVNASGPRAQAFAWKAPKK